MAGSRKWVISDLHLGHKNILKFSGELRGGSTVDEHDEWLREQWNSVVGKNDLVYVLGDVAFGVEHLEKLRKFKGNKILIRGNHDPYATQDYLKYFQQVHGALSVARCFWLTHIPIHPTELRGRINIHGHVHQNSIEDNRYINACVEASYGIPQSLDELIAKHQPAIIAARERVRLEDK